MTDEPLLRVSALSKFYGARVGCEDVCFELWPGEVLAVVGKSGSGKTTLLKCLSTRLTPTSGLVSYRMRDGHFRDLYRMSEAERRFLMRTDWGFVHQNPADGLRMTVSAGANVGERLMAVGDRHYGNIRDTAVDWLARVEIGEDRVDDEPRAFSGGMRQRLQIARNLVTGPRLVFMDEPTGGLDVSVQARLLDLLRGLVTDLGLAAVVVTHDLAVARLLSHRMMVMKDGRVIETGLTDRVLDDPREPYTQLLVSSILQVMKTKSGPWQLPAICRFGSREKLHHASARRHPPAGRGRRLLRAEGGRMRRARRAIGRRQELDPEDALRQLRRRCRPDHRRASRPARRSRDRQPAHGAGGTPQHDRLCQPVPAHRAARLGARCRRRAAGLRAARTGKRRATVRANCWPAEPAREALEPAARHLLGRRAAARQHRARLHHRHPILLLDEPTASLDASNREVVDRPDRRKEAAGRRRCSASSTTRTCARPLPTASSTSPNSRRKDRRMT